MVALVTDSTSQLPDTTRAALDVQVVPITVVVDGQPYQEGIDLDADGFYALFAGGRQPEISTSQPSPGTFVEAYQRCIDAGHDEILSIHVTEALSGTLNSARIAAGMVDATVHLVDSRTASYGVTCAVHEAGRVLAAEGSVADAITAAEQVAARLWSVTALGVADLLRGSGRVDADLDGSGIDLLTGDPDGNYASAGVAASVDEACAKIADVMTGDGQPIRVALGIADASAAPLYEGIEARLRTRADVVEIVRYRIGPSIGAFTGPGTAGGFWYTADL